MLKTEKPVESVTPEEREQAKRLVYAIIYGMGRYR
jgi:DNA polymerase I-like protein with 3'-5' exonuclease and polymerase domains